MIQSTEKLQKLCEVHASSGRFRGADALYLIQPGTGAYSPLQP